MGGNRQDARRLIAAESERLQTFALLSAHEMLEPLVAIEAYATFALDRPELGQSPAADPTPELESIVRISRRTRDLLEVFLREMRPDAPPLQLRRVELDTLVAESLEVLAAEVRARRVRFAVEPLPAVDGDKTLLGSLFTNILANAVKYGPLSGGTITVGAEPREEEWLIRIGGHGTPINGTDVEAIFEPFRRAEDTFHVRGHGLGLSVCRRIAERHGGRVGVMSDVGAGNTFVVVLPRKDDG